MKNFNPVNSVVATSALVLVLVLFGSLVQVAALTSLTILIYYAITNISALRLAPEKKRYPKAVAVAGLVSSLGLTAFLPLGEWLWTALLIIIGVVYIVVIRKIRQQTSSPNFPQEN